MHRNIRSGFKFISFGALAVPFFLAACLSEEDASEPDFDSSEHSLTVALQAEQQSWSTSSGDTASKSDTTLRLQANASGDTFAFTASVPAGTYAVALRYAKRNSYGNYRVEVNGTSVGTLAGYSSGSSDSWSTVTLGAVALSGSATIRFVSIGKDAGATDYDLKVDYVELRSSGQATPTPTGTSTTPTPTPTPTGTSTTPTPSTGTPSCSIPSPNGQQAVSSTLKVSGTLDGGLKRYYGSGSLGTSGQSEGQGPLFELADGATLRNVILGSPAADGVHCKGTCTLENVYWEDVGEDAATFKGSSSSQVMTINGGVAKSASDKVFQHNGPGTMVVKNFCADSIGKLYRSCGNCSKQYARSVAFDNVVVKGAKSVAGINSNYGDVARFSKVSVSGNPTICQKYTGTTSGEPKEAGSGADGKNCIYSSSDITKL
ncbi:MAG: Pectate lyase [Polyangiaceae bacterium]|nr:Pectate lyase [Polyangiaceae bacterium]